MNRYIERMSVCSLFSYYSVANQNIIRMIPRQIPKTLPKTLKYDKDKGTKLQKEVHYLKSMVAQLEYSIVEENMKFREAE